MASGGTSRSGRPSAVRGAALQNIRTLVSGLGQSARAVEARVGVTNAQLFLLAEIGRAGETSVTELATLARAKQNAVSMTVARLVDRGLVTRTRSRTDGRRVCLTITAAGRRILARAPVPPTARLIAAVDELSEPEASRLSDTLARLIRFLGLDRGADTLLFEPPGGARGTDSKASPAARSRRAPRRAAKVLALIAHGALAGAALTSACSRGQAASLSDARGTELTRLMAEPANWASYGRDYTNQRFSPLAQITAANVGGLRLAWHYKTGIRESFETSPIVVGGTMYITTPKNHVVALDAATGAKKWEYAHALRQTIFCCGPNNRGVAYAGGRLYMGTLDARLVALDTADGHVIWSVQVEDNAKGYSITHAPVAVNGLVIVGVAGAEYGIRGSVSAYDATTGALRWRWHTIPSPAEGGWWGHWSPNDPFGTPLHRDVAQEKRDSAKYADAWEHGGGSMWQTPAVDSARGLVIFTVGNASPDIDGHVRPGDNLYTNSICALDVATGHLRWYMQEVPHDVWDYDAISPVILADVRDSSGHVTPAAAQAGKTGWVYVVDRATGKPLRRTEAFVPQQGIFSLPTRAGTRVLPGGNGGSEWSPAAYSPQTGYMYVLGLNEHDVYKLRPETYHTGASYLTGVWYSVEPSKDNGTFTAVDLSTGRVAWQDTLPDPMVGGAMATAGGVVFVGTKDRRVLAYDARTGKHLWQYAASAGVNAPPVSYAVNGRQYVAVAAGGNFQINAPRGDELLVFALPRPGESDAPLPPSAGSAGTTAAPRR